MLAASLHARRRKAPNVKPIDFVHVLVRTTGGFVFASNGMLELVACPRASRRSTARGLL